MSILKVANVHFNADGSNRIEWRNATDNVLRIEVGALRVPVGDTTSRPTGVPGQIRYNSTTGQLESYNATSWGSIVGAPDIVSGTRAIFSQTAAPTGWTKDTVNYNEHTLRVVTGAAASGGSVNFTTAFASQTPAGSVSIGGSIGGTTLSTPLIPSHDHNIPSGTAGSSSTTLNQILGGGGGTLTSVALSSVGGGGSHTHPSSVTGSFSGSAINLAVRYLDVITATKD